MNYILITRTIFLTYSNEYEKDFGFRISDNYELTFCDMLTKEEIELPDEDFIKFINKYLYTGDETMIHLMDLSKRIGLYLDGVFYTAENIVKLLED